MVSIEHNGICTPFLCGGRVYFGYHKGKAIYSTPLGLMEPKLELHIDETPVEDHISSPAVYGDRMFFHGGRGRQRTWSATFCEGKWICQGETPFRPYYRRFSLHGRALGLAKYRGIEFYEGERVISRLKGPFRHCHVHDGRIFFSRVGDHECIEVADLNPDLTLGPISVFRRPERFLPTRYGPARHDYEYRDPYVDDQAIMYIQGERILHLES